MRKSERKSRGWKMTGKLMGLGLMMLGMVLLLTALLVYNKAYK